MHTFWTLLKIVIGLAIAIPLGLFAIAATVGILGAVLALAVLALKLAFVALVGYGAYRLVRHFFAPAAKPAPPIVRELPSIDPYYAAAMRELDAELGRTPPS
jgi:hypothetical protein